jgi:hypothetical protein
MRTSGALLRALGCGVVVSLLFAACSEPSHRYVRNTDLRSAFKVPTGWTTFTEAEVLGTGTEPQPSTPDPLTWVVGIDGDPRPSAAHVLDPGALNTDHPNGVALVQEFSFQDRDAASFSFMRNYIFPVDELIANPNNAQVLTYDDALVEDGFRGVHLIFQFRFDAIEELSAQSTDAPDPEAVRSALARATLGGAGAGLLNPDFVTVNQISYIDRDTSRVYFFAMLCSAACYDRNRGDIESTVDSWTVQPA